VEDMEAVSNQAAMVQTEGTVVTINNCQKQLNVG